MGYWYWRNLKNNWVVDESATNRFDFPERGHISGLQIRLDQVNNAYLCEGYNDPYPVHKTAVRILGNGNVEIIDVRMRQMEAMNFWETGKLSTRQLWTVTGMPLSEEVFIPFGRWLGDPKYGLICEKFPAGVQFEDTNTWSTTYVTDGSQRYTINALMRKDPEPGLFSGGYLSKKQISNEVAAARVQYGIKLPTRNKLKQIYVFSEPRLSGVTTYLPDITPWANLSTLWLSIKSKEEYIIDNMGAERVAYLMHQLYGRVAETGGISGGGGSDAYYLDSKLYEKEEVTFGGYNTSFVVPVEDAATNFERISKVLATDAAGNATNHQFYWHAKGICPHGICPLLLQDPMSDESQWFDAGANADVYVEGSEGTSAYGRWYIVLDELQKQPAI